MVFFLVGKSDSYLIRHLNYLGRSTDRGAWNNTAILGDGAGFNNGHVQPVVLLLLGVESVHEVHGEHAQMFVEKLDVPVVDALCNLLADLMRAPSLNHVVPRPSILRLSARAGSDKKVVLEFPLQTILLDVFRKRGGHFSGFHIKSALFFSFFLFGAGRDGSNDFEGDDRTWGTRHP